jgi:tetratricopeptide (TPR) repeat protein
MANLEHREILAAALRNLGGDLLKLGRPAQALDAYGRAFTLLEQLIKENPAVKGYAPNRGLSLVGRGRARSALGDPAGAAADVRHALKLSEGLRLPEGWSAFCIACSHAALAGLAGQEGTGGSDRKECRVPLFVGEDRKECQVPLFVGES